MLTDADRANLIERASDTLKPLTVEALKKDPGLAFQPASISAFVTLQSFEPAEWARWKSSLKVATGPICQRCLKTWAGGKPGVHYGTSRSGEIACVDKRYCRARQLRLELGIQQGGTDLHCPTPRKHWLDQMDPRPVDWKETGWVPCPSAGTFHSRETDRLPKQNRPTALGGLTKHTFAKAGTGGTCIVPSIPRAPQSTFGFRLSVMRLRPSSSSRKPCRLVVVPGRGSSQ